MGVHGLWELLAPVGRRVSVETLAGKRLAIDASIWIIQFMKAMRDEKGEMVRNAHILGFFRRICKLLFLRTRPVFVFDGGTPALKRRTVIARRRQRENAQAKIRKTAEKLLLNHLKEMRLKELAADLEKQRKDNNVKGKKPISEVPSNDVPVSYNQEELDEMLAASLAAEENEGFNPDATTSGAGVKYDEAFGDEEEDDEDEEMILPEMHGKVDPAVLAALPPSMQLDLLVQMRERLMAENRQKYQKVKKAPSRFSELQIESYLKTVAFRREIDGVQKAASGRGIGGVQTSRIASEANREYIFSSSFTGDKQALTSLGQENLEADQSRAPPATNCSSSSVNEILSKSSSRSGGGAAGSAAAAETGKKSYHEDVETYRDERGRIRVSRGRALGIQMTRDLQRNLDLMKEIDREKNNSEPISVDKNNVVTGTSIEISFEDTMENENGNVDDDDKIFARLVAGDESIVNPVVSDNEWEEGVIENEGEEVEWEDGFQDNIEFKSSSSRRDETQKNVTTKGALEEEANIQEAIRRSLEDTMNEIHEQGPEIEASPTDVSPETVSKGAMEEEVDIQDAIKKSLEDISGRRSTSDFQEDDRVISDEDRASANEWEEGPGIEADVSQAKPTNALDSNSAEFVESNPDEKNPNLLHQDGDGHAVNELVGGSISAMSSSLTDEQQMFRAALDDHSCSAVEIGKVSAVDSITNVDGTNVLAKEKIYEDFSMEKDEVARSSTFVSDNMDREMEDRLEEEMTFLGKEREELGNEQRKLERNSESVSSEMFAECQELLQMFGLPYIIAPMEAEAQCAFMELSNLVDGVVTEDSDAFLFGARSVYKNIFDDRKYVETYFMKDIENELGLDREKLVHMALLLGSDYTEGISGIGIVNAIEVVNAFPGKDGLREFREWIESPDPSILGKLHVGKSIGKGSKGSDNNMSGSSDQPDGDERIKQIFMDKHRNVSKNWNFSSSFPSDAVISAYVSPQVDKSTESLAWGKPDLFVLRKLCWEKFGWGASKSDELLLPVLKEYNKHETQLRLEAFYTFNERFAKIRSKRITKAVKQITKHKSSDLMDEAALQQPGSGKKRKAKSSKDEADQSGVGTNNNETTERPKRGRTKSRGRGRGQTSGRGKKKTNSSRADTENSSESDEEMQLDELEESRRVRRSGRVRKTVNYNISDEFDDSDKEKNDERFNEVSMAEYESLVDRTVGSSFSQGNNANELNQEGCDDGVGIVDRNFVGDTEEMYGTDNKCADLIDDNQMDENSKEGELSKEYLQPGGGFCVDEDGGEMENTNEHVLSPTTEAIIPEKSDGPNIPTTRSSDDEKTDLGYSEVRMNDATRSVDEIENDLGDRYSKSLRSMPNLRRKKKRN
ncbi:DNA repair protein uvh3 [Phtheirospermum japonicum]|uniref:DNA repair protein uvh3 n=1 Tax=Phtheirospermum japonicum TaxID=374723 RepID=A0A830CYN4_9LAMI|nr:DNA repair protein uvh3 [Phtheirospermum japonicum]